MSDLRTKLEAEVAAMRAQSDAEAAMPWKDLAALMRQKEEDRWRKYAQFYVDAGLERAEWDAKAAERLRLRELAARHRPNQRGTPGQERRLRALCKQLRLPATIANAREIRTLLGVPR